MYGPRDLQKNVQPYRTKLTKGCPWQDENLWKNLSFVKNDEDLIRDVFPRTRVS